MSGRLPDDAAERDALAAEFVLGTLDARAAARVSAALMGDAGLREAVAGWERRLAPLSVLALPEAPPPDLWGRIDAVIAPAATVPVIRRPRLGLWRLWAVGATLAAAAFAGVAFLPHAPAPAARFMAVLVTDQSAPAFAASVGANGGIHLAAMTSVAGTQPQTPTGRQLQLWGMPPGAKAPTSLGLVPVAGGELDIATPAIHPVKDMLILISVEPPGGSPTGQPTGPVVFFGRLVQAGNT